MGFVFKKIISAYMQPTAILLGLLFIGIILSFRGARRNRGLVCLITALVLGMLSSFDWMPNRLLGGLERRYSAYDMSEPGINWILVLGRGFSAAENLPDSSRMDGSMHARLAEALRIIRGSENATILMSIAGTDPLHAKEKWLQDWCRNVGVSRQRIVIIADAVDTGSEIKMAMEHVAGDPFILVTSASHMPRAMRIADHYEGAPIPAPCDYQVFPSQRFFSQLVPSSRNIVKLDEAFHEYIGIAWHELISNFDKDKSACVIDER